MTKEEALAQSLKLVQEQLQSVEVERLVLRNAFKLLVRRLGVAQEVRVDLLMLASVLQSSDAVQPRQALECLAGELQLLGERS